MTHIPYKQIDPITTGLLRLVVKDNQGSLVTDAVATGTIYDPTGKRITAASDLPLSNLGAGVYQLEIDAEWSSANGTPILGIFAAVITITRSLQVRTKRFQYLVDFTE